MINGVFSKPKYIAFTIIKATPIILTGLSVAFAFRTGLFNIGAEGQYIIGTIAAALAGYFIMLPYGVHPLFIILIAALAGGIWGGIAGILKAKFGINEVISTIMLNWIAFYTHNAVINIPAFLERTNKSKAIQPTASINILERWRATQEGKQFIQNDLFWKDIFKTPLNYGFVIAIIVVILVWYLLNKTTVGYQLRAVGFNKFAAEYGGINVPKNITISMFISGAIAGIAGAIQVMGVSKGLSTLAAMEGYGFDGIAVALIGSNNPFGCLFAGLLYGILQYGGSKVQSPPVKAPTEIINIMIGTVIFFIAIPRLIKWIRNIKKNRGGHNE